MNQNNKAPSKKIRIDLLLVQLGLIQSREKAQRLIMAGKVLVNDTPCTKPGTPVSLDAQVRIRHDEHQYVSRGALKLIQGLKEFKINAKDKIALDVGASTGGFTEVLLQEGASLVHALDVGHNQLDWKIRSDSRVKVYEGVNARHCTFDLINQKVSIIVMDVSFISVTKILPNLIQFAEQSCDWVVLIKPQFEAGPEHIKKGGIVTSPEVHQKVIKEVCEFALSMGLQSLEVIDSPIKGTDGNREFLAHFRQAKSQN